MQVGCLIARDEKLGELQQASEERPTRVQAITGCNHAEQQAKQAENGKQLECFGFSVGTGNAGKDANDRSNHRNSLWLCPAWTHDDLSQYRLKWFTVGAVLLPVAAVTAAALKRGIALLSARSSVTAEAFHARLGFKAVRDAFHGDERTIIMECDLGV
jgi:hypothetical protein